MSNIRQTRRNEDIKNKILETARQIIAKEGIDGLSIRKITNAMEYTPGIVYHYFKDKQEIITYLLYQGYQRILAATQPPGPDIAPDAAIREAFVNYIHNALTWAEEWKAFLFSSQESILAYTSIMGKGSAENRKALKGLCQIIERGVAMGLFAPCDSELTAQVLWLAMFGLLARLMIEKNISEAQRERLIHRQLDIMIKGIAK